MKKKIDQLFDWATLFSKWMTVIASVCMAIMMVVVFSDIVGTKFFKASVPGALDITEELMVFLTLLPMAYLAAEKRHINITLLEMRMSERGRYFAEILKYGVATLISGVLTWRVFIGFQKALAIKQLKGGIDIPTWPANLITAFSFGILTLVLFLHLLKSVADTTRD